jgi:acyl-CoA synthetase (AMP-forming)/AMP-acid ligase II
VLVWEPNGLLCLAAWFGINMLGAVFVGINTAYRGSLLRHVIENSDASVIVCHPELAPLLLDCAPPWPMTVFTDVERIADPDRFEASGLSLRSTGELRREAANDLPVKGSSRGTSNRSATRPAPPGRQKASWVFASTVRVRDDDDKDRSV